MSQPAKTLHSPKIRPEDKHEDPPMNDHDNDHGSRDRNTEVTPQSPSQIGRRSTTAAGYTTNSQNPDQIFAARNANHRVGKPASKRSRGMSVSMGRGRATQSPVKQTFSTNNDSEEEYLANQLAGTPRKNPRRRLHGQTGRRSLLTNSRKQMSSKTQLSDSGSRVQAQNTDADSPVSGRKVSRRSSGSIADRRMSKKYNSSSRGSRLALSGPSIGTEANRATGSASQLAQTGTGPVDGTVDDDLARSHLTLPEGPETKLSIRLGDSSPIDNSRTNPMALWAKSIGTPNSVFGDPFGGSFSASFSSPLPTFERNKQLDTQSSKRDSFTDTDGEHEELRTAHNVTRKALQEVEKRNRELEEELESLKIDHAKTQEMLEKEEAEHKITRMALDELREEKNKAEQKAILAAAKRRENKPIWQVDSEGKQARLLYDDYPNMMLETNVLTLLARCQAKFILTDYEDMAKFGFEALAGAERLRFEPLSARCHFNIGIAYYNTHRYGEAQHHFLLAKGCEGKYGISQGCVLDWLEKCDDSLAGAASGYDSSPTRDNRDTDRYANTQFSADTFYATPTHVSSNLPSMDQGRNEDRECIVGQKESPSQKFDDGDNEVEYFYDSATSSPKVLSLEEELALSDESDDRWSDAENDEDFQDLEEAEDSISESQDDNTHNDEEILTPKAEEIVVNGPEGSHSKDHDELVETPRPQAKSLRESMLQRKDTTRANKPPTDPSTSRAKPSTTTNPLLPNSSRAPLKDLTAQKRDRTTTSSTLKKMAQKYTTSTTPRKLPGPLSTLKSVTHIPIKDMEAFVNRPLNVRREEAAKGQSTKTATKAFVLYRAAYAARAEAYGKSADARVKSGLMGESWGMETVGVRERFEGLARVENEGLGKAFPKSG